MSTELVKASTPVAGIAGSISVSDIVLPSIHLVQSTSARYVGDPDFDGRVGDYVDTETSLVVGTAKEPLEIIPFHLIKFWELKPIDGNSKDTLRVERITPDNINADKEEIVNGVECYRRLQYRFYAIRADASEFDLPYTIKFKAKGTNAAKTICNIALSLARQGKPSFAKVLQLTSKADKNEKGNFYVPEVKVARDATPEELALAAKWYKDLACETVVVRDEDDAFENEFTNTRF